MKAGSASITAADESTTEDHRIRDLLPVWLLACGHTLVGAGASRAQGGTPPRETWQMISNSRWGPGDIQRSLWSRYPSWSIAGHELNGNEPVSRCVHKSGHPLDRVDVHVVGVHVGKPSTRATRRCAREHAVIDPPAGQAL